MRGTIKIGAMRYAIKHHDHVVQDGVKPEDPPIELLGSCDRTLGLIHLSNIQSPQAKRMTMMHEIVHAILWDCGFTMHDEHHVDMLANHFTALVQENPRLVSYLQGKTE